MGGSVGY
jgi:hypothetical protein